MDVEKLFVKGSLKRVKKFTDCDGCLWFKLTFRDASGETVCMAEVNPDGFVRMSTDMLIPILRLRRRSTFSAKFRNVTVNRAEIHYEFFEMLMAEVDRED